MLLLSATNTVASPMIVGASTTLVTVTVTSSVPARVVWVVSVALSVTVYSLLVSVSVGAS